MSSATYREFPSGTLVYAEGDPCSAIAFLLSGEIRVYKNGEGGREITLYEIGRGETCILNASCILSNSSYPANAVTVEAGSMVLIPAPDFRRLIESHEGMRNFVFGIMSRRLKAGFRPPPRTPRPLPAISTRHRAVSLRYRSGFS